MNITTLFSSRPVLFALSLATACSAAACLNTVSESDEGSGADAAALTGAKKNALAIYYKNLPPIGAGGAGGSTSYSTSVGQGGSYTTNVAVGVGVGGSSGYSTSAGQGGAGASWPGSSNVATSSVSTGYGSQTATSTGSWGSSGGGCEGTGGAGGWSSSSTWGAGGSWEGTGGNGGGGVGGGWDTTTVGSGGWGTTTTTVGSGGWGTTTSGAGGDWPGTTTSGGWGSSSSSVSVGGGCDGGGGIDPNTLYLMAGSSAPVCSNPYSSSGCGSWFISIGLPPSLQHKGTIPLGSLLGSFSESGPDQGCGYCSGGGGSLLGGTLTILKINSKQVTFRLDGTNAMFTNAHADGTYVADLCN